MMRWLAHWNEVLAVDRAAERRLVQGRAWVRSGRVTQVRATDGLLQGRVQGSAATPYAVDIRMQVFTASDWEQVDDVLAGQARHRAHLLAGQAPEGLEDQLSDRGLTLLPTTGELDTGCACGSRDWPCVHVAAVWEAAAARLPDDPFLVFRLRGRGRQQLLNALAGQRREEPTGIALDDLPTRGWTAPRAPLEEVALPELERARDHALLRLLGDPPGWEGRVDAHSSFGPLVEQAVAACTAPAASDEPDSAGAEGDPERGPGGLP